MYNINTASNVIQFPNPQPENTIPVALPKQHIETDLEASAIACDLPLIEAFAGDVVIYSRRYSSYTEKSVFVVRINSTGERMVIRLEHNGETVTLKSLGNCEDFDLPASDVVIIGKVIGIQKRFDF